MNKPYFFLTDWHHKRLENTIDLLLFYGEHLHGFSECVLINDGKKNDISITTCGFVAFYGKINDSIKLQKENSVMQQDLTSPI